MVNLRKFNNMKIVVPTNKKKGLQDMVADHFGRCNTYTFLDEKGSVIEIIDNTSEHMRGRGLPPEVIKEYGASILLCKDLGPRALNLCSELGIDVYVCSAQTVKEIFEMWRNNKIKKASIENACDEHKI